MAATERTVKVRVEPEVDFQPLLTALHEVTVQLVRMASVFQHWEQAVRNADKNQSVRRIDDKQRSGN